jgi:hypothetical protein
MLYVVCMMHLARRTLHFVRRMVGACAAGQSLHDEREGNAAVTPYYTDSIGLHSLSVYCCAVGRSANSPV